MLIVVNSMPKCGSTWFHNFIERCVSSLGHPTPQKALEGTAVRVNPRGNPGAIEGTNLDILLATSRTQTLVVKAHVPPNAEFIGAIDRDEARTIFILRHPVDIAKSALAYGEFCRAAGWDEPYRDLYSPRDAVEFIAPFVEWAAAWLSSGCAALVSHYEDLFSTDAAILDAAHRLAPEIAAVSARVLDQMRPENLPLEQRQWLRVNLVRRPELDPAAVLRCEEWAKKLGYPLHSEDAAARDRGALYSPG